MVSLVNYHSYWQCTHSTTEGPGLRTRLRWVILSRGKNLSSWLSYCWIFIFPRQILSDNTLMMHVWCWLGTLQSEDSHWRIYELVIGLDCSKYILVPFLFFKNMNVLAQIRVAWITCTRLDTPLIHVSNLYIFMIIPMSTGSRTTGEALNLLLSQYILTDTCTICYIHSITRNTIFSTLTLAIAKLGTICTFSISTCCKYYKHS